MKRGHSTPRRKVFAIALAAVAVLGISAVSATGAQALSWQKYGTKVLSGTESEAIASSAGTATVTSKLLGASVEFNCGLTTSGSIVAGGSGSTTINLTGCNVSKPSHCAFASAPVLKAKTELVEVAGQLFQKFTPSEGTSFGSVEFVGVECPLAEDAAPLKGSFAGSETSTGLSETHSLGLTQSGTWPAVELKFGATAATLTGEVKSQHLSGLLTNHAWRPLWQSTHGAWELEAGSPLSSEYTKLGGGPVTFGWSRAGSPVSFTCSEPAAESAFLQTATTENFKGLAFVGCTVTQPAKCSLSGGGIHFPEMTGTLISVGGKTYEKISATKPEFIEGKEKPIMGWSFDGPECSLAGTLYSIYGSIAALGPQLGLLKNVQPFEFSKEATEILKPEEQLGVGHAGGINVSGSLRQELSGGLRGISWGAY
jgi:hypothetical protein